MKKAAIIALLIVMGTPALSVASPVQVHSAATKTPVTQTVTDGKVTYKKVINPNGGEVLTYSSKSGLNILNVKAKGYTYAFKDLNNNGKVDSFEDWRKDDESRATALAKELTKEQIAGLMLFSAHETKPSAGLTKAQKKYLKNDNLRNVLNAGDNDVTAVVNWNNQMQQYVEKLGMKDSIVLPVNFSSDPRSTAGEDATYNSKGDISRWPSNLGVAATFDESIMYQFSKASSQEYRAMGIATALGPQMDLATDPRWLRFDGTFGENASLSGLMAQAYVDGTQSTYVKNADTGWGKDSVNAMIKHFPGDGSGEGGRESHMFSGKYAVYPTNNYQTGLVPFESAIKLKGKTGSAVSAMSSYSIGIDKSGNVMFGTRMGSAYDKTKIDLLRNKGFNGVICTDWGVTDGVDDKGNVMHFGTAWGAENLTVAQRHFAILKAGVDMFGGNNQKGPVLEAYKLWDEQFQAGQLPISAQKRFQQSAERLLLLMIRPGLFENPYLSMKSSKAIVGSTAKKKAGFNAQVKSIVMLKNEKKTISAKNTYKSQTVYIPSNSQHAFAGPFNGASDTYSPSMNIAMAKKYFKKVITDIPIKNKKGKITGWKQPKITDVDVILVGMRSPDNGTPFSKAGYDEKTKKYYPLSLQYKTYTANGENVRKTSIAGDIDANGTQENRSYFGNSSQIGNADDLAMFDKAVKVKTRIEKAKNKKIPVIVALKAKNPMIVSEFESRANSILVGFSVSDKAFFDLIAGKAEPSGLLPAQFPKDMNEVEKQSEDQSQDMTPYTDEQGNVYDFGFGLNYKGQINDARTQKLVTVKK